MSYLDCLTGHIGILGITYTLKMALRVISLLVGRMKFHWAGKYFLVC